MDKENWYTLTKRPPSGVTSQEPSFPAIIHRKSTSVWWSSPGHGQDTQNIHSKSPQRWPSPHNDNTTHTTGTSALIRNVCRGPYRNQNKNHCPPSQANKEWTCQLDQHSLCKHLTIPINTDAYFLQAAVVFSPLPLQAHRLCSIIYKHGQKSTMLLEFTLPHTRIKMYNITSLDITAQFPTVTKKKKEEDN